MRSIDWYFDYISPFAYLQARRLGELPSDVDVNYKPVLFAGLLKHWGTKGPVELPAKRVFTYRYLQWYAERQGIPFRMPPAHPFNPLPLLRLTLAIECRADVIRSIFDFVWEQGRDPVAEWSALVESLQVTDAVERIAHPEVKIGLRQNTERAIARGVFGVPTCTVGDALFWGVDATDMVIDYLAGRVALDSGEMARIGDLPTGARRGGN